MHWNGREVGDASSFKNTVYPFIRRNIPEDYIYWYFLKPSTCSLQRYLRTSFRLPFFATLYIHVFAFIYYFYSIYVHIAEN
jgi:hypothetical protein